LNLVKSHRHEKGRLSHRDFEALLRDE